MYNNIKDGITGLLKGYFSKHDVISNGMNETLEEFFARTTPKVNTLFVSIDSVSPKDYYENGSVNVLDYDVSVYTYIQADLIDTLEGFLDYMYSNNAFQLVDNNWSLVTFIQANPYRYKDLPILQIRLKVSKWI